jgi:hypothetical protein
MFFINILPIGHWLAMLFTSIAYGGTFTLMGIIAHESYGVHSFAKVLGTFMTAGAVGILIYEQIIFVTFYSFFSSHSENSSYSQGKWNILIFIVALASSVLALAASAGVYLKTRGKDGGKDKVKDFINF